MVNNLNNLIKRIENNKRLTYYRGLVIGDANCKNVSDILNIVLPNDFVNIGSVFRYDVFSFQEFFDFLNEKKSWGIVQNNLELRKEFTKYSEGKSDMSHILVLADDDGGSVFMITQDTPEKPTPIIWCDAGDMYWYSIDGKFPHPHDEWPSFTDFFEYLVEQEEKNLEEDKD